MASFLIVLVFAFLVEAVWERLQDGIPERYLPPWVKVWGAVAISIMICIFYRVDLVAIFLTLLIGLAADIGVEIGVTAGYTVVGAIITGFFVSRGADGTHKALQMLFNILDWFKEDKRPLTHSDGIGFDEPTDPNAGL